MLTMVIMVILALIVVPRLVGLTQKGREAALQAGLHELCSAIAIFHAHAGAYPAQLSGLVKGPITRPADWDYSTSSPRVGDVHSSASGQTAEGVAYSDL
jgi:type II secretory pathway pseudopilin PulG